MNFLIKYVRSLGKGAKETIIFLGALASFGVNMTLKIATPPFYWKQLWLQVIELGYKSIPLVGFIAFFAGTTLALQIYSGAARMGGLEPPVAQVVGVGMVREIAPVVCSIVIAGRIGASLAAEIGYMLKSQQIDAVSSFGLDPIRYLIVPRVVATTIVLPALILIADIVGIWGSYLVSVYKLGLNPEAYISDTVNFLTVQDISVSMLKSVIFGFIIGIIGCLIGLNSKGENKSVGSSVAKTIIATSIFILLANYVVTELFV